MQVLFEEVKFEQDEICSLLATHERLDKVTRLSMFAECQGENMTGSEERRSKRENYDENVIGF